MVFLILLIFPVLIAAVTFAFLNTISWKEFLVQLGAAVIVSGASAGVVSCSSMQDTETLNGRVTNKKQVRVSCSHSYSCNCREVCSGIGENRSCSIVCDTCYEHSYDWDWRVYTTIGSVNIRRIDRRGSNEPPRWSVVEVSDPVALPHNYKNYIKAAPDSLFQHSGLIEKYQDQIPEYPNNFYDYYKINRFVTVGLSFREANAWNADLMNLNAALGAKKQVNAVIVVAKSKPREWFYAVEQAWVGGKKNDAILVVSVDNDLKPQWVEVMAWTTNELFEVKLRDAVMALPKIDREPTIRALYRNIDKYYERKPMADFEYLKSSITPSTTAWVVSMLIGLIVSVGLAFTMHYHDIFGDER